MVYPQEMRSINAGEIIIFTSGEYDDYRVLCAAKATQELNTEYLTEKYFDEHPKDKEPYNFDENRFILWLVNLKLLEQIELVEWHINDGGTRNTSWINNVETFKDIEEEIHG